MSTNPDMTVIEMVRQWPVRSAVNIVGPQMFALAQFANSYYHDISLVYPAVFAVLLVCIGTTTTVGCVLFRSVTVGIHDDRVTIDVETSRMTTPTDV